MIEHPLHALTVVGCGYVGGRLASLAAVTGLDVLATVRTPESAARLCQMGISTVTLDADAGERPHPDRVAGRALVYMVPPPRHGVEDTRAAAFLDQLGVSPAVIVYISTSGVYGDHGGGRVDEDTPLSPGSARARRRVSAEQAFSRYCAAHRIPLRILRVPGIYGPGRLPLARIRAAEPVPAPGSTGPGNRIHVDDLAAICLAACRYGGPLEIFNAGDDDHRDMNAYFRAVADAAGLPRAPELPLAELLEVVSPAFAGFLTESRALDSRRARRELGVDLRYPRFEAGIAASLASGA